MNHPNPLPDGLTVAHHWSTFERNVIPPQAQAGQRSDMRMAFYGGATVVLTILTMLTETNMPEEEAAKVLGAVEAELKAFVDGLPGNAH